MKRIMHRNVFAHRWSWLATTTLVAILLATLPVVADETELARVDVSGNLLTIEPLVSFDSMRVNVSGPEGFSITRTFSSDDVEALELPGRDGFYKYELRFGPRLDDEARAAMNEMRRQRTTPADLGDSVGGDLVLTGSFSISGGAWVVPNEEGPISKEGSLDKVVLVSAGGGVIRDSLCVGFNCPNSPNYGYSTMLMMENNLRLHFGDTSGSGFPANDWEIEINSSASGGANHFAIVDCGAASNEGSCGPVSRPFTIEAGAVSDALRIESSGEVGLGTANPETHLHIVDGDTPTLRLDQDLSSGFTPQVWDIGGNETNFFVRDVTTGSSLPFRIIPGGSTGVLVVGGNDHVGINARERA